MSFRLVFAASAGVVTASFLVAAAALSQLAQQSNAPADSSAPLVASTLTADNTDGGIGDGDFSNTPPTQPNRQARPAAEDAAQGGAAQAAQPADPFQDDNLFPEDPPEEPGNGVIDGLVEGGGAVDEAATEEYLRQWRGLLGAHQEQAHEAIRRANRQPRAKRCNTPNVVVLVIDDLGYGDLGAYGQKLVQTPNIDVMAYQGIRFTNYYAGTSVGVPSRCSFMSGLHTGHTQLRQDAPGAISPEVITLAEVLWQGGYDTGMIGNWTLGEPETTGAPFRQGFESSYAFLELDRAKEYYPDFLWDNDIKDELEGEKAQKFAHEIFTRQAEQFIIDHKRSPFFLYVSFPLIHGNIPDAPTTDPYSEMDWPEREKQYAAMMTTIDDSVARIKRRLEKEGLDQNTIIVLTSDNGPRQDIEPTTTFNSTRGLRGAQGELYEGGIRVPMIVYGKGHITRPHISDHVWAAWDIVPTLADVTGCWFKPKSIDGISQAPLWLAGEYLPLDKRPQHDYLYWEVHKDDTLCQAMRMKHWKAVRERLGDPVQVFNLRDDPKEEVNVAADNPDIARQFNALFTISRVPQPGERFAQ